MSDILGFSRLIQVRRRIGNRKFMSDEKPYVNLRLMNTTKCELTSDANK